MNIPDERIAAIPRPNLVAGAPEGVATRVTIFGLPSEEHTLRSASRVGPPDRASG
jgi:hypothetical protein